MKKSSNISGNIKTIDFAKKFHHYYTGDIGLVSYTIGKTGIIFSSTNLKNKLQFKIVQPQVLKSYI